MEQCQDTSLMHSSLQLNMDDQMNHSSMNHSSISHQSAQLTTSIVPIQGTQNANELATALQHIPQDDHMNALSSVSQIESLEDSIVFAEDPCDTPSQDSLQPNPELTCEICHKSYDSKRFLNYHYTSTHKQQKKNIKCGYLLVTNCTEKFRTRKEYEEHLQSFHKCVLNQHSISFSNVNQFEEWKEKMETSTSSLFIYVRGGSKSKDSVRTFKCSYTGDIPSEQPEKKKARKRKTEGPTFQPMGAECPSYIKAVISQTGVEVTYISTHVGHDVDSYIRTPSSEARKRITLKRLKLEEKQQARDMERRLQDDLCLQRSEIINDLNCINLLAGGEKGKRIEKLLQMFRFTLDMFKETENQAKDQKAAHNGTQVATFIGANHTKIQPTMIISETVDITDDMF